MTLDEIQKQEILNKKSLSDKSLFSAPQFFRPLCQQSSSSIFLTQSSAAAKPEASQLSLLSWVNPTGFKSPVRWFRGRSISLRQLCGPSTKLTQNLFFYEFISSFHFSSTCWISFPSNRNGFTFFIYWKRTTFIKAIWLLPTSPANACASRTPPSPEQVGLLSWVNKIDKCLTKKLFSLR